MLTICKQKKKKMKIITSQYILNQTLYQMEFDILLNLKNNLRICNNFNVQNQSPYEKLFFCIVFRSLVLTTLITKNDRLIVDTRRVRTNTIGS